MSFVLQSLALTRMGEMLTAVVLEHTFACSLSCCWTQSGEACLIGHTGLSFTCYGKPERVRASPYSTGHQRAPENCTRYIYVVAVNILPFLSFRCE